MRYKFTGNIKTEFGVTLKQIVRISDNVIGGWIEKENYKFYKQLLPLLFKQVGK